MPQFNTVAERDAYYANKLKTAGVAPQQGNFTSSINSAQATRTTTPVTTPATTTKTLAQTTAPGADSGSWITTRPITTSSPAVPSAPAAPAAAASAQAPTQLNIPTQAPSKIESTVTQAQTAAEATAEAESKLEYDYQKQVIEPWNKAKAQGLLPADATPPPPTRQEALKQGISQGQAAVDYAKAQSDIAAKLDQSQQNLANAQGKSAISGVQAAMAQSREGVVGTSKPLVASGFSATQNQILADSALRVTSANMAREQALIQLKQAQDSGNSKAISAAAAQVAGAEAEIRQSKIDQMAANEAISKSALDKINTLSSSGMLNNATEEDIAALSSDYNIPVSSLRMAAKSATAKGATTAQAEKFKNQTVALETLKGLVTAGVSLPPALVTQYANQTGLSANSLTSFNDTAAAIMADKNLSIADKEQQIKEMSLKLDQEQRGIWGQEMQKMDYINRQIAAGASQEEIDSLKTMMGITTDSREEAETSLAQAKSKIAQYEAENQGKAPPYGTKEYFEYKKAELEVEKAQAEINTLKGISNEVDVVDKKTASSILNSHISQQFGVPVNYEKSGKHGGLDYVLDGKDKASVDSPVAGKIISVDVYKGDPKKQPYGNSITVQDTEGNTHKFSHLSTVNVAVGQQINAGSSLGNQGSTGHSTGFHVDYRVKSDGKSVNPAAFLKDIVNKKVTKSSLVPPEIQSVAEDAANGIITYSQMLSGAGKDGVKYKNEFSRIVQEKAAAEPDPLVKKMILSRAKGDPDTTTEQSWTKASQGFTQVLDLKDTLDRLTAQGKTGIINGSLAQLNPLDPDVSLLKGQMAGLVPTVARGTFGEVGVLTDADIANYQRVIGDQTMTPEQINKATSGLIKTIYRNYTSGIDASPKNTANRIDQYKSIKSRLPAAVKSELGIKDYEQSPSQPSWLQNAAKGFVKQLMEDQHTSTGELIIPEDMETKNPPVTKFKF